MNTPRPAVTLCLAEQAQGYRIDALDERARAIAAQCVVDWFAVTLAARGHPARQGLMDMVRQERDAGPASIVGAAGRHSMARAALVNATASHALDYDDVNPLISGHPTAVILPAALALGQALGRDGKDVLSAFVAGYETACRVGRLVNPGQMDRGFHATGTVCGFGAAVACSRLLGFDARRTARAMGLAGTAASGLKAMFGTPAKALHAGLAARNGLEAALLVRSGYQAREDILECPMGFAATHSPDFHAQAALEDAPQGLYLYGNLFKYDASCYGTHAAMACIRSIMRQGALEAGRVRKVRIRVDRSIRTICNIERPATGLQGQFSLRLNVAFAMLGIETADPGVYDEARVNDPRAKALMESMEVEFVDGWPPMQAEITAVLDDGTTLAHTKDAALPERDIALQSRRVAGKFTTLVAPVLGAGQAGSLLQTLEGFERLPGLDPVMDLCVRTEFAGA